MIRIAQGVILALGLIVAASGADSKKPFVWISPQIGAGAFSDALGMLDREREEYATNLAVYASNEIAREKASAASLEKGRRILALSMHLAARNRRALVVNYQLSRGILPEPVESSYSQSVLARLIFTRAQMLRKQGGMEDQQLARIFVELAAELDPKNEDAVYASELQRLDHGRVNWKLLTDVKSSRFGENAVRKVAEGGEDGLP